MKTKLPGLNGLRAIAASFVLFGHVFQIAGLYGDTKAGSIYQRHNLLGTDMVNLFFVISGFIITYILCKEKKERGTISLRNFYIKRFLRIWPLYFLVIGGVVLLTHFTDLLDNFVPINSTALILLATFLVTLGPYFKNAQISVLPHYWSLSVEEQFYIFWPLILKSLKGKWLYIFPCIIIIGLLLLRNGIAYAYSANYNPGLYKLLSVLNHSMFGSISIGILGAFMLVQGHSLLRFFFRPIVQIACWLIFICSILFSFFIPYVHYELMSVVCLVLILNVTANNKTLVSLENKFFDKLGTISYGIYMYHWVLIPILIVAVKKAGYWDFFAQTYQLPLLILGYALTCLVAFLSFKYIESYFLKLKPARAYSGRKEKLTPAG